MSLDSDSQKSGQKDLLSIPRYDKITDVLIIGYGGSGAVAAITAHDLGADVLILEKTAEGGGNTRVSGGGILCPKDMVGAQQYLRSLLGREVDDGMIKIYVKYSSENADWLTNLGGIVEPHPVGPDFPAKPHSASMIRCRVKGQGTSSQNLWKVLTDAVRQRGIEVYSNTLAKQLLANERGVVGALAEQDGKEVRIFTRKGVILACGGFEYDEGLKQCFLPAEPIFALGNPSNTGDGIRMAQSIGSSLWHMDSAAAPIGYKVPEFPWAIASALVISPFIDPPPSYGFIYVDKHGRRFINESDVEYHMVWKSLTTFDAVNLDYHRIPSYIVFDDVTRRSGPIARSSIGFNQGSYRWSNDNEAEIQKGWIQVAESVEQLASKTKMQVNTLQDTIRRFNESANGEKDDEMGRRRETIIPLMTPPFYSIKIWPCLVSTHGGPKRDSEGRVLDAYGKPIPRLFSVGELGSLWGSVYQGGGMLAECISFGRIAGERIAELPSLM
ncbi:MAG: FAD-binding protein [Thaumarchaeota archaeon]|nr:FAD-binding protein [Nitrososphaerota archaeon]